MLDAAQAGRDAAHARLGLAGPGLRGLGADRHVPLGRAEALVATEEA